VGAPGFDDAPLAQIERGPMKHVTIVMPYYRNPLFLRAHIERWSALPADLKSHLAAIVVDDGSPEQTAQEAVHGLLMPFPVRLFRIEKDVRWNWLAARNIGMNHADGWCVLTDMDHVIPRETLEAVVFGLHDPSVIYRFSRREHDGRKIHPHPNSVLMTREMFWKVGGYDEALSGHYGTDGDWRRRCARTAKIRTLIDELERHEYEQDSSTTHYLRKQPQDAGKKAIIAKRGKGWKPKTLSFKYHEVVLC
jgi:glycosyltransferase involved in cell wall biosynthesis